MLGSNLFYRKSFGAVNFFGLLFTLALWRILTKLLLFMTWYLSTIPSG